MRVPVLPDADWRHDAVLLRILATLDGPDMTRVVGGAVRDALIGDTVSDVDLATRLHPPLVVERLEAAGIKAVPTGIAHGTITAVADGRSFEVTTLRRDVATDGRRATIAYTDDWAEDAARRDFTINAIYAEPQSGALYDPTGGIADLAARRVRFIGDAGTRIDEDHLRILRWFRFVGRFGVTAADPDMLSLMRERAPQLRGLSRERVADELMRILALDGAAAVVAMMQHSGVLAEIIPESPIDASSRLAALCGNERAAGLAADPVRRLLALLPGDAAIADRVAARLKMSNRMRKRMAAALAPQEGADLRGRAYRVGTQAVIDQLLLSGSGQPEHYALLARWQVPRMPVSGADILALGVLQGPEISRILRLTEQQWIAAGFPDRAETLVIAARLASSS